MIAIQPLYRFLCLSLGLWLSISLVVAQENPLQIEPQYKITYWTTDNGLPGNSCIKIFQDKSGFLWIGSFDGLVRFDGARFITYNKGNQLTSNYAVAMVGSNDCSLWIGTDHGLSVFKNGKFIDLSTEENDFFIEVLYMDESLQKIWIGSRNSGFFTYDIATNKYQKIESLQTKDIVNDILKDANGDLWIGTEKNGLVQYSPSTGLIHSFSEKEGLINSEVKTLFFDKEGVIYVGTSSGLYIKNNDGLFEEHPKFRNTRINKIAQDPLGNLWIGTVNGLYIELPNGEWMLLKREQGLSNNDIRDIFFDSDGTAWLGTYRGGLNQLRETKFKTYFTKENIQIEAIGALCQLDENTILAGTTEGELFKIKNGLISKYPLKTKMNQRIYSLFVDSQKSIWVASYNGLLRITPDGKERLFTDEDGLGTNQIRHIFQDKRGNYWVGTRNAGVLKMFIGNPSGDVRFEQFLTKELNRFNSTFIMGIAEDKLGNILLCTNTGGLTIVSSDGSSVQNYNKSHGLGSNTCFGAYQDQEGVIWVTTTEGLSRIEDGKVVTFTRSVGMPFENPMDIEEDDLGNFWLPTQKGIIRVSKQHLNDFAQRKNHKIGWKLFDKNNDLIIAEGTGTAHLLKGTDGTIWFPMIGGLISLNPASIKVSNKTPKVFLEKITADDKGIEINDNVQIAAGNQRLAIDYIALALEYPNSPRYKYKLDGFDRGWVVGESNLQASYTNLAPGEYLFTVIASNSDGIWPEEGTSISFNIKPYLYQTWWFISLSFISTIALVLGYIHFRTLSIKKSSARLERMVSERTIVIAEQRDALVALNEELRSSQEEVMAQRDALSEKIEELAHKNDEIADLNTNLEKIVAERTKVMEEQNIRISRYAFINAHKLRAPLASILGLINLMNFEANTEKQIEINQHLLLAADDLDKIVRSINRMLESEFKDDPNFDSRYPDSASEE